MLFGIIKKLCPFFIGVNANILNYLRGNNFGNFDVSYEKKSQISTISQIELDKYLGSWFQIYGSYTNVIFQGYGKCITAEYSLLDDGTVGVINSQINKNNELEEISGYAYYTNASEPGKLTVHLDGTPVDAPYWIIRLGEVKDGQYQYSIITTPSGVSLWVLARDIDDFYDNYNEEVLQYLDEYNFKFFQIDQDEDCVYNFYQESNWLYTNYKSECQVASYLKNAGFPQANIPTMVCISKYESSFNCDATNKNTDGSTDYGLMQINSYYWCSGDPLSKYNECKMSCSSLFDCQNNAKCAYTVWKQQGYNAWYGYKYHKTECDNYKLNC
jgi:lysozyme C